MPSDLPETYILWLDFAKLAFCSTLVKGVKATTTDGKTYTVAVPAAKNDGTTVRAAVTVAAGATVSVKDAAGTEMTKLNSALKGDRTWTVTVTAADKKTTKTYTLNVAVETAPLTLATGAGISAVTNASLPATSGTITVSAGKVGELVDAIKAQLTTATNVCIKATNAYGAESVVAAETAVATGQVLYATSAFGTVYTWNITV